MEVEGEGEGGMPMRIFVGGLGESVTAEDLNKTFSSLGLIKGVEIVRTSGRSFAYMDFQPSSSKALAKLFSTYNGCIWKGGRLRLEKAKEHYLVRLRREWEEDAELAKDAPKEDVAEKKVDHSEKLKSLTEEKMQLKIFFPGLRKMKSLPYRGSGKHKYSFQRIEVPSLPIHFCDCEEHCGPIETTKREHVIALETQSDEADEEELNIMRTVLDKILKRGNDSGSGSNETKLAAEGEHFNKPNDYLQVDETDAADDLVINMVNGENGGLHLMGSQGATSAHKESKFSKHEFSEDARAMNKLKAPKRKDSEPFDSSDPISNKKARLPLRLENNRNEFSPTTAKKKGSLETLSVESKVVAKPQPPEQKGSIQQSTRGLSWLQKSSWKKMVGETSDKSFSISQIFPDAATKKSSPIFNDMGTENPTDTKKQKKVKTSRSKSIVKDGLKDLGLGKERTPQDNIFTTSLSSISPSKITSEDSEGPREAKPTVPETDIRQSISKSTGYGSKDLGLEEEEIPQDKVIIASGSTEVPLKTTSEDSEGPKEAKPTDRKTNNNLSARGPSWIQKSSWRDLVGETNNSPFSISHILPGISSTIRNVQKNNNGATNCSGSKQNNLSEHLIESTADGSEKTFEILKDGNQKDKVNEASGSIVANQEREDGILPAMKGEFNLQRKNTEKEKEYTNAYSKPSETKSTGEPNKKGKGNVFSGEVCTFMRTAGSKKEWEKLKTAIKGPLKKKRNIDDKDS